MKLNIKYKQIDLTVPIGIIACSCVLGYWLCLSIDYAVHDYANSYFGAYFFLKGNFDLGIFDPYTFNKRIFDEGFKNIFASYNPNPPFTALFFSPLALLPLTLSKFIFNLISCVWLLLTTHRLCKHVKISPSTILIITPLLFFIPIRNEILFGQTYFLLFVLIAEGYIALEKNKKILTAFLWSVAILIKVFPIIVVLFLLIKKDWKTLAYLILISGVLLSTSIALQGIDVWCEYVTQVLPRNSKGEINSAYTSNYQSAHMFFKYLFLFNSDLNPDPILNSNFLFEACQILYKGLILGFCSSFILQRKDLLSFGLLILAGILISPYGSTYTNILLLIILIAAFKSFTNKELVLIGILIFLISNLPLNLLNDLPKVLQFPRLLFYSILFLTIVCLSKIKLAWKFPFAFIILFFVPFLIQQKKQADSSVLLFKEQNHNLVFNYGLNNNRIFYNYWNERGENQFHSTMNIQELNFDAVELRNNQIFVNNKQITNTADNKLKPALINNKAIIYLSDKDRGIGFYKLRLIKL